MSFRSFSDSVGRHTTRQTDGWEVVDKDSSKGPDTKKRPLKKGSSMFDEPLDSESESFEDDQGSLSGRLTEAQRIMKDS